MHSTVHRRRAALAAFLATMVVAACGGGAGGGGDVLSGDPPSGLPESPSGPAVPPVFTGLQNFAAATVVFGQDGFTSGDVNSGTGTPGASSLFDPAGVAVADDGKVFIADAANARLLVLPRVPDALHAEAAFALGQPDVSSGGITEDPRGYRSPQSISIGAGKVAVADSAANRVVIYESVPTDGSAQPTVVIGQPNFDTGSAGCDESSLNSPSAAVITPEGRLIVTDTGNSRVLVWNSIPTSEEPGRNADVVLGQQGFLSCAVNAGGGTTPARGTLRLPRGVWSDGTRMAVADTSNSRVLLWDDIRSLESGRLPDRVLGQPDFDTSAVSGPDRHTLALPRAVASNGTHLAVSDGNHRVLLWNAWPSEDGHPADSVIGQQDFLQDEPDDSGESAQSLDNPYGMTFHQDKLLVVDEGNNRLLIFKSD